MSRSLSEIYNNALEVKNRRLNLTEADMRLNESQDAFGKIQVTVNSSKMSVMNAFLWIVSACIWTFENLLDVFQADIIFDLQKHINGTAAYYVNALSRYQHGDELVVTGNGTQFGYSSINEKKRVITRIAYSEIREERYFDRMLVFKVAKDNQAGGGYMPLSDEELKGARAYLNKISFAGTHCHLSSRKGDILVPKVDVYHDGALTDVELRAGIRTALTKYIHDLDFNATVYVHDIIQAIKTVPHVLDVFHDQTAPSRGIFVIQFDDDGLKVLPKESRDEYSEYEDFTGNHQQTSDASVYMKKIDRMFVMQSGFMREAQAGDNAPNWDDSINLIQEASTISDGLGAENYCNGKP